MIPETVEYPFGRHHQNTDCDEYGGKSHAEENNQSQAEHNPMHRNCRHQNYNGGGARNDSAGNAQKQKIFEGSIGGDLMRMGAGSVHVVMRLSVVMIMVMRVTMIVVVMELVFEFNSQTLGKA